jgi:ABC-type Zn2+ transport system substrate-binding protein/surface adhesin
LVSEGFTVNEEKDRGARKVQMLEVELQELAHCIFQKCFKQLYEC